MSRPAGVLVALALICVATLSGQWSLTAKSLTGQLCLVCDSTTWRDVILNVGLFLPLGFSLARLGFSPRKTILVGLSASVAIEIVQATMILGRVGSAADILTNTAGAWLGAILSGFASSAAGYRRIAVAVGLAWCGQLMLTAIAIRPAPPAMGLSWLQLAGAFGGPPFAGDVGGVMLNERSIGEGPLPPGAIEQALAEGRGLALAVEGTIRCPQTGNPLVAALADETGRRPMTIRRGPRTFRLSARPLGARHGWTDLRVILPVEATCRAGPISILASHRRDRIALQVESGGRVFQIEEKLTPLLGWSLGMGLPLTAPFGAAATLAWTLTWACCLGWLWHAALGIRGSLVAAVLVAIAPPLTAAGLAAALPSPAPIALGVLGVLSGAALARRRRSVRERAPASG